MKTRIVTSALVAGTAVVLLFSCTKNETDLTATPLGYPKLPPVPADYALNSDELATLGRVLFYERALSLNNTISCGSCHRQENAFADNKRFSRGLHNGFTPRNTPAIIGEENMFSMPRKRFWDGRAAGLDTAVLMPVANTAEMHIFDFNGLTRKLARLGYYQQLFADAFGGDTTITVEGIRDALSVFCYNMMPENTSQVDEHLNALEQEGRSLFQGKAGCYSCHRGGYLNGYDSDFKNIGLDMNYADAGRSNITGNTHDAGRYIVPTLINIEKTAPYMHDGRFNSLREVIDHYDHGIQPHANLSYFLREVPDNFWDTLNWNPNMSLDDLDFTPFPVKRLNLSEHEKQALEAYLKALTDDAFLTDPKFSDPFR
jgi:cytochrome c peroxidase